MSRIIISNNNIWASQMGDMYKKAGFKLSHSNFLGYSMYVFKKLNINNSNYYENKNDFIACNGSLIYKEMIGQEALKNLLEDLHFLNISDVRKYLVGTYIVVVKIEQKIKIFVDECGICSLYYYQKGMNYLITNTFYHIEKFVHEKIDTFALLEELNEYCIFDNKSPFKDIYRLMNDEVISLDLNNGILKVDKLSVNFYCLDNKNLDNIISIISEKMKYYSGLQKLFGKEKVLFMTGGMDSRLVLAADMAVTYRSILANWQGDPFMMNTKIEDRKICKLLSENISFDMEMIDVSDGEKEVIDSKTFDKYGEYARIYGNNKKWISFFESGKYSFFDFGYFGETIKGWDLLDETYTEPMTVDRYVEIYMGRQCHNYENISSEQKKYYINYVSNKIISACDRYGLDKSNLKREECMFLYYLYRTHADTKCCNLANTFGYSFNLFAEKKLLDYIHQIPYEIKQYGHLNLALTKYLCPELLTIPYFSHCHYMSFDNEKMILSKIESSHVRDKIKKIVVALMVDNMKRYIRKNMTRLHQNNIRKKYVRICKGLNMDKCMPFYINTDTFSDMTDYLSYWSTVCMMNGLMETAD